MEKSNRKQNRAAVNRNPSGDEAPLAASWVGEIKGNIGAESSYTIAGPTDFFSPSNQKQKQEVQPFWTDMKTGWISHPRPSTNVTLSVILLKALGKNNSELFLS